MVSINYSLPPRWGWLLMAAVSCAAVPMRNPVGVLRAYSDSHRHAESSAGHSLLQRGHSFSQVPDTTISSSATLPDEKVEPGSEEGGYLLGAFSAASSTIATELLDTMENGKGGTSKSWCFLMVFLAAAVCWLAELVLAKSNVAASQDGDPPDPRLFLHAVSFARYLMAWHVVLNHFAYGGESNKQQTSMEGQPWAVFARWGILAAPWFMMLSGFSNSYSKLVSPLQQRQKDEDFIHAMLKRVGSWYPFYFIALIWCAIRIATVAAEDWAHLLGHGMTIHGWVWGEKATFPYLTGDVWLSWLVMFLLTWAPVHSALADSDLADGTKDSIIWTIFTMSFLITIPSVIMEWLFFQDTPLFNMVQLWPSFIFGQALAFWFVKNCMDEKDVQVGVSAVVTKPCWVRKNVTEIPIPVRFGATISFFVFGIMFFILSPYDPMPLIHKPILPLVMKGFQLPVQGLMIAGLAAEIDPMAKLFARRPFRFAERLAMLTFIFQGPVHNTVKDLTGKSGMSWEFVIALIVFTVIVHYVFEQPYRRWRGDRERGDSWKEELEHSKSQK